MMLEDWTPKRGTAATDHQPAGRLKRLLLKRLLLKRLLGTVSVAASVTLCLLCGGMALASTPALAAPEAPVTRTPAASITATSAVLEGTLNPGAVAKAGWYFDYSNPNGSTCAEGPATPAEPEVEGEALPEHAEATGLEPSAKYEFCMVATNELGESTPSANEVTFETEAKAPEVLGESTSAVMATEARLEGTVNPNNQVTECHIQYAKTSEPVTTNEAPCEPSSVEGFGGQGVGLTVTGLEAATEYHYRIVLKNASAEEGSGEADFETQAPPSELETGEAQALMPTSVELGGKLNPGGEATYYIEYGTAPCSVSSCGQRSTEGLVTGRTQESVTPILLSSLKRDTTYHYWLVADNGAASEPVHGAARSFTTLNTAPSLIENGIAQAITTTSAQLTGELSPGGEATYYAEYSTAPCWSLPCGQRSAEAVLRGEGKLAIAPITISGLKPNTVYHYLLVAKNAAVSEPVYGQEAIFRTAETAAEAEAEANAKLAAERASSLAAQAQTAEESKRREEQSAAENAAVAQRANEIVAQSAGIQHQVELLRRQEELIAATSIEIVKLKVTGSGVQVTVRSSQAGDIAISGTGLKGRTIAKAAAGSHTVTLTLTKAGKKDRKHRKKTTVTVSLDTSLTSVAASGTVKL
jgi:hypothetical protein